MHTYTDNSASAQVLMSLIPLSLVSALASLVSAAPFYLYATFGAYVASKAAPAPKLLGAIAASPAFAAEELQQQAEKLLEVCVSFYVTVLWIL